MTKKSLKYQDALEELNTILEKLQAESIDVDELSRQVKKATELIKFCRQKIHNTEFEIKHILDKFEQESTKNTASPG